MFENVDGRTDDGRTDIQTDGRRSDWYTISSGSGELKTNTSVPSMFQGLLNIEDIWVQHRVSPEPFNLLL